MAINKVIYGGNVLIDLTADTVEPGKVLVGFTYHGADGEVHTGTCTFDLDTSGATATASEVLDGKTFGAKGVLSTGTMVNNGAVAGVIKTVNGEYIIPIGFHDGSGKVTIDPTEAAKIIAQNIKAGVEILGVTGTYTGEGVKATSASATPYTTAQTVLPPEGFDYLSQVTVEAIYYNETDNAAGGKTATIGTVAPTGT